MAKKPNPSEEFAKLRARRDALETQIDTVATELKAAQGRVFALAAQNVHPSQLDEARSRAVSTYEAYLDLVIEQNVIEGRLQE